MAYSVAWNEAIPTTLTPANTIATEFDNLKKSVRERMETLLGVGKWSTDPISLPTSVLVIPACAGSPYFSTMSAWQNSAAYVTQQAASQILWNMPIVIPTGCTIIKLEAVVFRNDAGDSITLSAQKITDAGATSSILGGVVSASTGWHVLASGVLAIPILSTESYSAQINMTSVGGAADTKFAHLKITYTRPVSNILQSVY